MYDTERRSMKRLTSRAEAWATRVSSATRLPERSRGGVPPTIGRSLPKRTPRATKFPKSKRWRISPKPLRFTLPNGMPGAPIQPALNLAGRWLVTASIAGSRQILRRDAGGSGRRRRVQHTRDADLRPGRLQDGPLGAQRRIRRIMPGAGVPRATGPRPALRTISPARRARFCGSLRINLRPRAAGSGDNTRNSDST